MPRANLIFWFKFTEFTKYVVMAKELQQPVKEVDVYKSQDSLELRHRIRFSAGAKKDRAPFCLRLHIIRVGWNFASRRDFLRRAILEYHTL
jgi:hypothetical protein